MDELRREHRITARSLPEIVGGMEQALARLGAARRVLFRGRKLSNEAFINAALLHLVRLPDDEQERVLREALAEIEGMLGGTPAASPEAQPDTTDVPRVVPGERIIGGRKKRRNSESA